MRRFRLGQRLSSTNRLDKALYLRADLIVTNTTEPSIVGSGWKPYAIGTEPGLI